MDKQELEMKYELASREVQMLQEQENLLLNLQLTAESQLRDARQAQQRLLAQSNKDKNQLNPKPDIELDSKIKRYTGMIENYNDNNKKSNETTAESHKEVDERMKQFNRPRSRTPSSNVNDNLLSQIDAIQQHIGLLRESTDNRNQLIQLLDNRDAQLQSEHQELQGKLYELQKKKSQVDQLASQLQSINDDSDEEGDVGK